MNLSNLKDQELLSQIKLLVQSERDVLAQILHHLREVEKRKLFSDLKYQSLFDYAVKELKYSEGQAGRRIQAMRLLKELPQIEEKVQAGELNLSQLCQARTYFRDADKKAKQKSKPKLSPEEKLEVIKQLQNKSARETDLFLLSLEPDRALPKEQNRVLSEGLTEIRFIQNAALKEKFEEVRALLGLKGYNLTFAEFADEMATHTIKALREKRFGKRRTQEWYKSPTIDVDSATNF